MLLIIKVFPKYISLAPVSSFTGMIHWYQGFGLEQAEGGHRLLWWHREGSSCGHSCRRYRKPTRERAKPQ